MKIYRDLGEVPPLDGRVVTIGAFDGVHLGHRALLRLLRELAVARGLSATVLTFDRHPAEVVRPELAPPILTPLEHKLSLLADTGDVDECVVLTFDEARSKESAEVFVSSVLGAALAARVVVVGADFHFGHRRRGNVELLSQMGPDLGFEVLGLGLVATPDGSSVATLDSPPYSSTRVRLLLASGDVEAASEVLGRDHTVTGRVEHGDGRGAELGFPTANVSVSERLCLPGDGVYAGYLTTEDDVERLAAISLGRRPTFYATGGLRLLEAHVLDFSGDLYGQQATVRFGARIRPQMRFEGPSAAADLVSRMRLDVEACRALLDRS